MNRQRGLSLSGLLMVMFLLVVVALLGMKVVPSYIEYGMALKAIKAVSQDASLRDKSPNDVRRAFERFAVVDNITRVTPADLDVTKEGGELVVSFAYEDRIPLFMNVSLVIAFEGSSLK